ncbi:MAG: hypothetical protein AUG89_07655 [Acidobacteria bacterium 13_1_20CM_4_56_7]|nr:MAG: hypothetical protein AUG89_07655 [Acidobacteria bacterium 13_1_20CM_4_56_7]
MKKVYSMGLGLLFVVVALLSSATATRAQEVTASITGTVTDASAAAVSGATITAKSVERGIAYTAVSNESGIYRISLLPVGHYDLRIEKQGFQTSLYPAFVLTLNQVAHNLPLASRNYVQLTLLAPGSVSTDPSSFNNGNNTGGYGGRPLINGNREQANNFLLDGMDNNQVSDNLLGYTPAPDAIQEFNLITNNASAEFGNFMGGIVNATIKSGTNSYHGNAWEFFRNDVLNANSWSNNFHVNPAGASDPLPKDKLRWNMFGATFGGPVIKNRLFFFADYQGQRFDIPSSSSATDVFTALERTGDFGALCSAGFDAAGVCTSNGSNNVQLYNACASFSAPCTPSSTPAGTRQPFPFNRIPAAMISPVAQALFSSSLYPAATGPGTQLQQSTNSQVLLSNSLSTTPIYNTVGDWTRTIGSNLVNDFRFGWSHVTLNSGNSWDSSVGQFGDTLGIGNGNPAGLDGLLGLNFANSVVDNIGTQESTQSFDDHVWQLEDSVAWTRGRHNFKFGGQYFSQVLKTFYAGNNGELGFLHYDGRFTSTSVGSGGGGNGGDGAADFLLGLPDSFGRGISTGKTWEQSSKIFAFYVEDTWRATDRLTLNLGVRYEAHTPWVETNNQQANYNFATGNIDLAGQSGASRALYKGFYGGKNFQPRIGFAWTPERLGGHTVVRGAFTISSYLEGTGTNLRLPINAPFSPSEINVNYNSVALPLTTSSDGVTGAAAGASCAAPTYDCYAGALLRRENFSPQPQPARRLVPHLAPFSTRIQLSTVSSLRKLRAPNRTAR